MDLITVRAAKYNLTEPTASLCSTSVPALEPVILLPATEVVYLVVRDIKREFLSEIAEVTAVQ